jgi:CBS domain-containing protein
MKVPFWFASFSQKNNYRMTAKGEESIIYAIPIAVFRPFVANNAAVLNFY